MQSITMDEKLDREPLVGRATDDHTTTLEAALAKADQSVRRARRLAILFGALVPLACFALWCSHHATGRVEVGAVEAADNATGRAGMCEVAKARTVKAPYKNIWRNLEIDEVKDVRSWLFDERRGINLTTNALSGPKWVTPKNLGEMLVSCCGSE